MRRLTHGALLAGLAISGLSTVAVAQQQANSALFGNSTPSPLYQTLIDELIVTDKTMTVRKLLPILKEKVPAFQYIAEDGPWANQLVPPLELRAVTILEIFDLIQRWNPSFHWDVISGGNGGPGVPIVILGHDRPTPAATYSGQPAVQVYSLSAAVDRQLDRDGISYNERNPTARKRALTEVMSLLENVAKQASLPNAPLEISIHDETEAIVVKGFSNQSEAISRAVMSFNPVPLRDGTTLMSRDKALIEIKQLQEQVADLAAAKQRLEALRLERSPSDKK